MQVFIKSLRVDDSGICEWYLIELQGELQFKGTYQSGNLVADLHYTKSGIPILIIGNHILYGKIQKMLKPFAVLDKGMNTLGKIEYTVKALIHRKLIFSAAPKPIVSQIKSQGS